MNKYKLLIILLLAMVLSACHHTPKIDSGKIAESCHEIVNINIQLNTEVEPSIPMLVNQKQSSVCILARGKVIWTRVGENAEKGFEIKFKELNHNIHSSKQSATYAAPKPSAVIGYTYKATYAAPNPSAVIGHAYGITMPDAGVELDPVIVIIPR